MNAETIARGLGGRKVGRAWMARCPAHDDRSPSLSIADGETKLLVHCFAGCVARDVLTALRRMDLLRDERLDGLRTPPRRHQVRPARPTALLRWSVKAETIWQHGKPIFSTVVEAYLRNRGCMVPKGSDLRFLPADDRDRSPAMMARITDFVTGEPLSLHFTKLTPDGRDKAPVEKPRLFLFGHQKAGGVIRLSVDAEVSTGLGLAEGIETALAVATAWSPVWAAIDAGNMARLPLVAGIEALTIFADHDPPGIKAAGNLASRWRAAGREAVIVAAPNAGTDWNEARAS